MLPSIASIIRMSLAVIGCAACVPGLAQSPTALHQRIEETLQGFVDQKEIAGAVTVVATGDTILDTTVVGQSSIEDSKPLQADSIFWIASMTKPITGVAVMLLEEEGKLSLDAPVSDYLPEFKELKDAEGKAVQVTLKQLLTHSAGLSELKPEEQAALKNLSELTQLLSRNPCSFRLAASGNTLKPPSTRRHALSKAFPASPFPSSSRNGSFSHWG